jgi:hypothetical protein
VETRFHNVLNGLTRGIGDVRCRRLAGQGAMAGRGLQANLAVSLLVVTMLQGMTCVQRLGENQGCQQGNSC